MSDLHEAVQAEIAARTPSVVPPFGDVVARRASQRRRTRRRVSAAVGASTVAVVVLAVTVLGGTSSPERLGGDGPAGPPTSSAVPAPVATVGSPAETGPPPRAFTSRPVLPSCGSHLVPPALSAEARACLAKGARNGLGAELRAQVTGTEGDPVVTHTRALPDGRAEVFTDATADRFGDQVWTVAACEGVTTAGAAAGCGEPEVLLGADVDTDECPDGDTSLADYVPFVQVGDELYTRVGDAPSSVRPGVLVMEVHCELSRGARPRGDESRSGDAAYLAVGTEVRQVAGFDPRFRLVVEEDGRLQLYERAAPVQAGSSYKVAFPGVVDRITGVVLLSQEDGSTEVGRVGDSEGVQRVRQALGVGYYAPGSFPQSDVFVGLELDDGSVVRRAYDSRTGVLHPGVQLTPEARAVLAAALR